MEIRVDIRNVTVPPRSATTLRARLGRLFARLGRRVARLHVTLKDENGPRGGRDKVCVLRAELVDGRQVVVVDRSERLGRAIVGSVRRARVLIQRGLQRRLARRRQQPPAEAPLGFA
jgi:hypothetical protein